MTVKLLTELHFGVSKLKKDAAQARLSLHMSKCHIVGNHISQLISLDKHTAMKKITEI